MPSDEFLFLNSRETDETIVNPFNFCIGRSNENRIIRAACNDGKFFEFEIFFCKLTGFNFNPFFEKFSNSSEITASQPEINVNRSHKHEKADDDQPYISPKRSWIHLIEYEIKSGHNPGCSLVLNKK